MIVPADGNTVVDVTATKDLRLLCLRQTLRGYRSSGELAAVQYCPNLPE